MLHFQKLVPPLFTERDDAVTATTIAATPSTKITNPTVRRVASLLFWVALAVGVTAVSFRAMILYHEITTDLDAPRAVAFSEIGVSLTTIGIYRIILLVLYAASWLGIGILFFLKRGDEPIGLTTAFFFVIFGSSLTGLTGDNILYASNRYGAAAVLVQALTGLAWLIFYPYWSIFPTGTYKPRWMIIFVTPWLPTTISYLLPPESPLYWFNLPRWVHTLPPFLIMIGLIVGQVIRYRTLYTPTQKAQTRWILLVMMIIGACEIVLTQFITPLYTVTTPRQALIHDVFAPWMEVLMIGVPLAFLFALLRYRLWDIDLAINRSIVYSILGGFVIAVIFLVVTAAQFLFSNTNTAFAILLSLVICALAWRPMLARIQHFVDVRLFGLRFDQNAIDAAQKPLDITRPGALSGRTLGAYTVADLIGQGGMGEVYKGIGAGGKTAAIKVISMMKLTSDDALRRFEREARAGMALNHPNIARVYDFGSSDHVTYMVQEFLEGETLKALLQRKDVVDVPLALSILGDVAAALDAAHRLGFIHRDVKPSNIMLCPPREGSSTLYHAVLMDFGITKVRGETETLTGEGAIGTIDYMAPEQIQSRKTIDGRADVYALGVVAYEMLTGQRPFSGTVGQVVFEHLNRPAPDPRQIDESIPHEVAHAIMQAMRKRPEERFDRASDFVAAMRTPRIENAIH